MTFLDVVSNGGIINASGDKSTPVEAGDHSNANETKQAVISSMYDQNSNNPPFCPVAPFSLLEIEL